MNCTRPRKFTHAWFRFIEALTSSRFRLAGMADLRRTSCGGLSGSIPARRRCRLPHTAFGVSAKGVAARRVQAAVKPVLIARVHGACDNAPREAAHVKNRALAARCRVPAGGAPQRRSNLPKTEPVRTAPIGAARDSRALRAHTKPTA